MNSLEALEVIKHTTDLDRPNELNGYHNEIHIIEKDLEAYEFLKRKLKEADISKDIELYVGAPDYKERFVAEYWELRMRYDELRELNSSVKDSNSNEVIIKKHRERQEEIMKQYIEILEIRAAIENIDLYDSHVFREIEKRCWKI